MPMPEVSPSDGGDRPVVGGAPREADVLLRLARGFQLSQAIFAAASLGVADRMSDAPLDTAELAADTGVDGQALRRLLRALAAFGIFREPEPGRFALTDLGAFLRSDAPGSVRPLVLLYASENFWTTWGALADCVRTGRNAFAALYGVEGPFAYYAQHPDVAALFDAAMTARSRLAAIDYVAAYDFSGVRSVVDVGGGQGHLLMAILHAYPALRGHVFDLPHVIDGARHAIRAAGLEDRCEATAGDMFSSVPKGADVYILSRVIHDWPDDRAVRILLNCRAAMSRSARVVVYDDVLPEVAEVTPRAQMQALNDLNMMVRLEGRERTEREFRALFSAADLRLVRTSPAGPTASALEAVPEP